MGGGALRVAEPFPELEIRNYNDLIDALVAVKNFLQISNETLEEVAGLSKGHADKMLGPSTQKTIGPYSLGCLLRALGVKLVVAIDLAQLQRNEPLFEKRQDKQVREPARISRKLIDRVRPIVLRELTAAATIASAEARRRRRAKNGHAVLNGHNGHAK